MRRLFLFFIAICLVSLCFSDDAEARRRRRRHRPRRAKIINEKKLFERIGGAKAISEIVDEWIRLNLADQRVAQAFTPVTSKPEKLGKMRRNLNDQLCEIADGPCQYKGSDMKKTHIALAVSEDQYLVVSDNLVRVLQARQVSEREKNELLARIGELRPEIVADTP